MREIHEGKVKKGGQNSRPTTPRPDPPKGQGQGYTYEKEAAFQSAVIELAQMLGWKVAHFRAARTKDGWRTPVAADGAGWPDLVLVRERVIFAECKAERGTMSDLQLVWCARLNDAGAEVYVWRPADWDNLESILRGMGSLADRDGAE